MKLSSFPLLCLRFVPELVQGDVNSAAATLPGRHFLQVQIPSVSCFCLFFSLTQKDGCCLAAVVEKRARGSLLYGLSLAELHWSARGKRTRGCELDRALSIDRVAPRRSQAIQRP